MQKLKDNALLSISLLLCGLLYFVLIIFQNRTILFQPYDPIKSEKIYSESQWQQSQNISPIKVLDEWALKKGYTGWRNYEDETKSKLQIQIQKENILKSIQDKGVSDSFLYSYVGYKYTTGVNPSLLNPEHPPFAKYLIGYSARIFGNEHILGIGIAFITLLLVAVVSYQLFGSLFHAGLAFFLTSIFPLFTDQIIHGPQLELYQLFFLLLVVHFLLMWIKKKKMRFCIVAGIFFGMLLSTKTLLPFLLLYSAWITLSFWKQWKVIHSVALFVLFWDCKNIL
jgi:predicted membrane-bound dolichyl-phosphate-mannose-protein mannosyltransferase